MVWIHPHCWHDSLVIVPAYRFGRMASGRVKSRSRPVLT